MLNLLSSLMSVEESTCMFVRTWAILGRECELVNYSDYVGIPINFMCFLLIFTLVATTVTDPPKNGIYFDQQMVYTRSIYLSDKKSFGHLWLIIKSLQIIQ